MNAAMLFLAVAFSQGQSQSLLREIIPEPTGRNGYEEYLIACDLMRSARVNELLELRPEQLADIILRYESGQRVDPRNAIEDKSGVPRETYEFAKKYRNYTVLQLRREAVSKSGRALELLNIGNRKPIIDPRRNKSWDTRFPEYGQMRALARLCVTGAYVAFADGRPATGTQYLMDALALGDRIGRGIFLARLVGIAIQGIAIQGLETYLPLMSAKDAQKVGEFVPSLVPVRPLAEDCLRFEFDFLMRSVPTILNMLESADGLDPYTESKSEISARELLQKLSQSDKAKLGEKLVATILRQRDMHLAIFRRPESEWDTALQFSGEVSQEPVITNVTDLEEFLSAMMLPAFSQLGRSEIVNRTQLRLVRLAALVQSFKWENDRLPKSLAEAVEASDIVDPVSRGQFQYEVSEQTFRVYSKGSTTTGEIGLRYIRPSPNEVPPPIMASQYRRD